MTKTIEDGFIVAGNPAKIIGRVKDLESKLLKYNLETKGLDYNVKMNILLNTSDDKFIKK